MVSKRLRRFLLSRDAAIAVMVLMAGLLALGNLPSQLIEPQDLPAFEADHPTLTWLADRLSPERLARSPWFLVLPAYLVGGISLSVVSRARALRRQGVGRGQQRFRCERVALVPLPAASASERVREALERGGFEWDEPAGPDGDPRELRAARGRVGTAGSLAFHVGLLLLVVGGMLSLLTRTGGELLLAEGFPKPFTPASFLTLSGAERFPDTGGTRVSVRDFVAEYSRQGTPVDYSVLLTLEREGDRREFLLRVNQAAWWEGLQLTLHRYGFAPELVARDPRGQVVLDAVGVLRLLPPGTEDTLPLADGGRLAVRLYPDFSTADGEPGTRSLEPKRPVILFRWLDPDGREVGAGSVELGAAARVAGREVAFPSLRAWGGFLVGRDLGLWVFAAAALFGTVGLVLRLSFPDQTIAASWEPEGTHTRVTLRASTRFFPALFEERIGALARQLELAAPSADGTEES